MHREDFVICFFYNEGLPKSLAEGKDSVGLFHFKQEYCFYNEGLPKWLAEGKQFVYSNSILAGFFNTFYFSQ